MNTWTTFVRYPTTACSYSCIFELPGKEYCKLLAPGRLEKCPFLPSFYSLRAKPSFVRGKTYFRPRRMMPKIVKYKQQVDNSFLKAFVQPILSYVLTVTMFASKWIKLERAPWHQLEINMFVLIGYYTNKSQSASVIPVSVDVRSRFAVKHIAWACWLHVKPCLH